MIVEVLIPVYGNHEFVVHAINSAIGNGLNCIISDDNPNDPLIDAFPSVSDMPGVEYHLNAINLGRAANYRRLLNLTRGDVFIMLDGDDYLGRNLPIKEVMQSFSAQNELVVYCGNCSEFETFNRKERLIRKSGPKQDTQMLGKEYFLDWTDVGFVLPHSSCFIRTKAARSANMYSCDVLNTDIVSLRMLLLEGKVQLATQVFSFWRKHGSNGSVVKDVQVLADNIETVMVPFKAIDVKFKSKDKICWLVKASLSFHVSSFHQIMARNSTRIMMVKFREYYYIIVQRYPNVKSLIIVAFLLFVPRIILKLIIGNTKFHKFMVSRGNYIYAK